MRLTILLFSVISPLIPLGTAFTATIIKTLFAASLTSPFSELCKAGGEDRENVTFPLICLLFTGPYNSVKRCVPFPLSTQTHKDIPFLDLLWSHCVYLLHPYLQHWTSISKHLPWSDHKILRNTNQPVTSPLSSRVGALITFLSKGVCICIYLCDHKHIYRPQVSLECSQPLDVAWGSASVKGLYHTLGVKICLIIC